MSLFPGVPARPLRDIVSHKTDPATAKAAWTDLVERLRNGEQAAMEDLYRVFSAGVKFYLWRQLGSQDLTDRLHDLFLIITESIQKGELREPERLMGYVRTVMRRQVAGQIHNRNQQRQNWFQLDFGTALHDLRPSPEHRAMRREYAELALRILGTMRERERDVLVKFYLEDRPAEDICREMALTETQFRLLKSRAKARLGKLCQSRLAATAAVA
jgi:RNA polymerase sigma-70 factor (ECF subfamily)